jgi:hypothetical protein
MRNRIIACRVFEDALDFLQIERRFPDWEVRFLPARLHLRPEELKRRLSEEISAARGLGAAACCLYGQCFPDIDGCLARDGAPRVPCAHCFEIFLGPDRYRRLTEEETGSYFVEKRLIVNFDDYCWKPLELEDPRMRKWYFEHYRRVIYIRQPMDPDLAAPAEALAKRIGLPLRIEDADYRALEAGLLETITRCETTRTLRRNSR